MFEYNWKKNRTVYNNLLDIKGISNTTAKKLCGFLGISSRTLYSDLANHKIEQLNLVLNIYSKKTSPITLSSLTDLDPMLVIGSKYTSLVNANSLSPLSKREEKKSKKEGEEKSKDNLSLNINHVPILNSLDLWTKDNIKTLIDTNTYRGRRYKYGYPTKGQRTRSNASTASKLNRLVVQSKAPKSVITKNKKGYTTPK